ncbi:MAG TPA: hypothetical protein VHT05_13780 [Candidatus Elarobacter sp.]|jgi:hypothetical protein|nr:hypothetical protein [Candidatus Elarobacter sp.]
MSPDWISAMAAVATLVIVAVGSFAALRQIGQMQSGTRAEVMMRLFEQWQSPRVRESFLFVRTELEAKLDDAAVRAAVIEGALHAEIDPAIPVANFFESVGALISKGMLRHELMVDAFPTLVVWEHCAPLIALLRVRHPYALELFEYVAVLQREYDKKRGSAVAYPKGTPRMPLPPIDGAE